MSTLRNILSSLKEKDKYFYYKQTEFLIYEPNLIKFRLWIRDGFFTQIYHNEETNISSFALISFKKRIFGRDKIKRLWHRHPIGNPLYHDSSSEGKKSTNLSKFLKEVNQILKELKLI